MKYLCPLCHKNHDTVSNIVDLHKEFWYNMYQKSDLPTELEEFNDRFGPLGLSIVPVETTN